MKKINIFLQILLVAVMFSCDAKDDDIDLPSKKIDGYTSYIINGFNVFVEDKASNLNLELTNEAINLLTDQLLKITKLSINGDILTRLKSVSIFLDWKTTTGIAQYHPSESWLIANGYVPEKAKSIEISNIQNFIYWTNQPYVVLHELAHAYSHRFLNTDTKAVIANAFDNAINKNLYKNVSYHSGNGSYYNAAEAYAITNEAEYFAELTEAYFGLNDYYPFLFSELETYDITGFNMIETAWEQ